MCSLTARKAGIVTAVLGFALGAPGLRAEGFDILCYKNYAPGFPEFCEHIAGLDARAILDHWQGESSYTWSSLFGKRHGRAWQYKSRLIDLSEDEKIGAKIAQAITPGTVGAENIRKYLEFFCSPRFARIFFPKEMLEWLPGRPSQGRLCCDVTQKKLKKDSPAFEDFGKYDLYLVRYEELSTGCFFEMIYCFEADGTFAGWYPTRLMAEWMARFPPGFESKPKGVLPDEQDRLSVCECFSNLGSKVTHTLGVKDFE